MHETNIKPFIANQCICCRSKKLKISPAILMPFVAERAFGWRITKITKSWGLNTIEDGNVYATCNSLMCENCFVLFLDIRFDDIAMGRLYTDYRGQEYTKLREKHEPGYTIRNKNLLNGISYKSKIEDFLKNKIPKKPKILDWGGDTGLNTPFSNTASKLHIYDISDVSIKIKSNLNIKQININEIKQFSYDLIVCSNVLEHVPYPEITLNSILSIMNDHSILYIEIPIENIMTKYTDPYERLEQKRHWHEHINFFSDESIAHLINNMGLEITSTRKINTEYSDKNPNILMLACKKTT